MDKIVADLEVPLMRAAVAGGNKEDYHYQGIVPEKDLKIDLVSDLREVEEGEPCPQCGAALRKARGIGGRPGFPIGVKIQRCP